APFPTGHLFLYRGKVQSAPRTITAAKQPPFGAQYEKEQGRDPGPYLAQYMRHAGGSRVEGLAVGDGEPVCGCQARLRWVEQVDAKGSLPFLAAGGLCHIVDAGLVRLVKRH